MASFSFVEWLLSASLNGFFQPHWMASFSLVEWLLSASVNGFFQLLWTSFSPLLSSTASLLSFLYIFLFLCSLCYHRSHSAAILLWTSFNPTLAFSTLFNICFVSCSATGISIFALCSLQPPHASLHDLHFIFHLLKKCLSHYRSSVSRDRHEEAHF